MGNKVVKVEWDQKVKGLQVKEFGLYSIDSGELFSFQWVNNIIRVLSPEN